MLNLIIKFVISAVTPLFTVLVLKGLLNYKGKMLCVKNILLLLLLSIINLLIYKSQYAMSTTIITFLSSVLVYKIIFNLKVYESVLSMVIVFMILTISDCICSLLFLPFCSAKEVRNVGYIMLLSNLVVGVISLLISKIRILNKVIHNFIVNGSNQKVVKVIVFFGLSLIMICFLISTISNNYKFISEYYMSIIIIIGLFLLFFFFVQEKNSRIQFESKYNALFQYLKTFEDILDNEKVIVHEYKNQLAAINNMNSIKEIKSYIESTLLKNLKFNDYNVEHLKNIPTGGLKGLLYYKIIMAKNAGLDLMVEISKNVSNKLEILTKKQIEDLIKIIGIAFDNAIEASEKSLKRNVAIEIYYLKGIISIVICNSFCEETVDVLKINEKGYTTKGKGRGNGLYYMNKILDSQDTITVKREIKNSYFITKIDIKTIG